MDYQDVLAAVGAGSAHPGGLESTQMWIQELTLTRDTEVLDIGCGTGRTLLNLNREYGCSATGVDIRPAMLAKARLRAKRSHQMANWRLGSAERLPFRDGQFDVVVAESVNVFTNPRRSIAEAHRVLKLAGSYVNVEMFLAAPVNEEWFQTLRGVYGVLHLPDLAGWKRYYRNAGFSHTRVLMTRPVQPYQAWSGQQSNQPDENLSSPGVFQSPEVTKVLADNAKWLEDNAKYLGYVISIAQKSASIVN